MIPILYAKNETDFTKNGIGALSDCISCFVTEERNGSYTAELTYPADGLHFDSISINAILKLWNGSAQLFRVCEISKPINGIVTIKANHISYDLSYIPVGQFTATGITATLTGLTTNALETCPFTFTTDLTNEATTFNHPVPSSIRAALGGTQGSVLQTFSGSNPPEFEWDNFTVKLWAQRGADNGVQLRYGKNIVSLDQTITQENATGVLPYWSNDDGSVVYTGDIQYSSNHDITRTIVLDLSEHFTSTPTKAQLDQAGYEYVTSPAVNLPIENLKISFVNLADTEEYKNSAVQEQVKLCDTVNVIFTKYGISAKFKVIKTIMNSLSQRFESIEVGEAKSDLSKTLANVVSDLSSVIQTSTRMVSIVQRVDDDLGALTLTVSAMEQTLDDSIATITYAYGYGTSSTTAPLDSAFTHATMPALLDGFYIWRRTKFTDNEGDSTYVYEMIQGVGEDGTGVADLQEIHYLQSPQAKNLTGNVVTIEDAVLSTPMSLVTEYTPKQNLNGYTKPWSRDGGGGNLFDPTTMITYSQYNSSGNLVSNQYRCCTPKIAVTGSSVFANWKSLFTPTAYTIQAILSCWDTNGTPLSRTSSVASGSVKTLPAGTTHIGYTFYNAASYDVNGNIGDIMIGEGDTNIPYSNICPITGTTEETYHIYGENLLTATIDDLKAVNTSGTWNGDAYTYRGITFEMADGGYIVANGTNSSGSTAYIDYPITSSLHGDLVFSGYLDPEGASGKAQVYCRDQTTGQTIKKWDGTTSSNYIRTHGANQIQLDNTHRNVMRVCVGQQTLDNQKYYLMIKEKSDTDYSPYVPNTESPINTPYNFGNTIYNGSVEEVSGTITHNWKSIELNTLSWQIMDSGGTLDANYFRAEIDDRVKGAIYGHALCSNYPIEQIRGLSNIIAEYGRTVDQLIFANTQGASAYIYVIDGKYADKDAFTEGMAGVQFVYELRHATTEQVPAGSFQLNVGELNNVIAENSDIDITYAYDKAVDPPVAEVVSIDRYPDIWTLSFPDYIDNYRYWYALQVKYTDNTIGWTTPMLDYSSIGAYEGITDLASAVSNIQIETTANMQILTDRISDVVTRTETIEENYINAETLENTLVSKQYVTSSDLTQTADNITASFTNYVRKDDQTYVDLATNIVFDADGINISSSNIDTSLQLAADGVSIKDNSNNIIASMTATEFTTGDWIMNQSNYVFNIFRKH